MELNVKDKHATEDKNQRIKMNQNEKNQKFRVQHVREDRKKTARLRFVGRIKWLNWNAQVKMVKYKCVNINGQVEMIELKYTVWNGKI